MLLFSFNGGALNSNNPKKVIVLNPKDVVVQRYINEYNRGKEIEEDVFYLTAFGVETEATNSAETKEELQWP